MLIIPKIASHARKTLRNLYKIICENIATEKVWIIGVAATEESERMKHEECGTCGYIGKTGHHVEKISVDGTAEGGETGRGKDLKNITWKIQ